MFFGKQKHDFKQLKLTKLIFDVKQLKMNKFVNSMWQVINSTLNDTLKVPPLDPTLSDF